MPPSDHVFVGTFFITTDNFQLEPPGNGPFKDVDVDPRIAIEIDQRFDRQPVSILGHMGERAITEFAKVPSLLAKKIVLKQQIEDRAFQIFESGRGGSAVDNWLRAEEELLAR